MSLHTYDTNSSNAVPISAQNQVALPTKESNLLSKNTNANVSLGNHLNVKSRDDSPAKDSEHAAGEEPTFMKIFWPKPRDISFNEEILAEKGQTSANFTLPTNVNVCLISKHSTITPIRLWEVWEIFRESFNALGCILFMQPSSRAHESHIVCLLDANNCRQEQGYKLIVTPKQIKIIARDLSGIYYGISTLREMLRASPEFILPRLTIIDWPMYLNRGLLIDLSVGRVPKIGFLTRMIDYMAGLKMNKLYLYYAFDVTLPMGDIWQPAYQPIDILFLERYCSESCITLVPAIDIKSAEMNYTNIDASKIIESSNKNDDIGQNNKPFYYNTHSCTQFLESFTNSKEIYIGRNLTQALLSKKISDDNRKSGESGKDCISIQHLGHDIKYASINYHEHEILGNFVISLLSRSCYANNELTLTFDSRAFTANTEDCLELIGPDSCISLQLGGNSSKEIEHESMSLLMDRLKKVFTSHGIAYTLGIESAWGTSIAGSCKSDFILLGAALKNSPCEETISGSFNINPSACFNSQKQSQVGAIFQLCCKNNFNNDDNIENCCNLSDYLFAWPTLLPLAAHLWTGVCPDESSTFYGQTMPYILSWHAFPQDVECILSNTLLELVAIENDASLKASSNIDVAANIDAYTSNKHLFNPSNHSFFYEILRAPDDVDLHAFTPEYFGKIIKILRKIHSNILNWQKKFEASSATLNSHNASLTHPSLGGESGPAHLADPLVSNFVCALELMTLACRLAKCLMAAGSTPVENSSANKVTTIFATSDEKENQKDTDINFNNTEINDNYSCNGASTRRRSSSFGSAATINPGIANINAIHKTDLANKILDVIALFKMNWLEHSLEDNLVSNVAYLEKLFNKLVPASQKLSDFNEKT